MLAEEQSIFRACDSHRRTDGFALPPAVSEGPQQLDCDSQLGPARTGLLSLAQELFTLETELTE